MKMKMKMNTRYINFIMKSSILCGIGSGSFTFYSSFSNMRPSNTNDLFEGVTYTLGVTSMATIGGMLYGLGAPITFPVTAAYIARYIWDMKRKV